MSELIFLSDSVFTTPYYSATLTHNKNRRLILTKENALECYDKFLEIRKNLMNIGMLSSDRSDKNMRFEVWGENRRSMSKTTLTALSQVPPEYASSINRIVRRVPFSSPAFLSFVEKDDTYNGKFNDELLAAKYAYRRSDNNENKYDCYHLAYGSYDVLRGSISPISYFKSSMTERALTRNKTFANYMEKFFDTPGGYNRELSPNEFSVFMSYFAEEIKEEAERFGYEIPFEKMPKVLPLIMAFTRSNQIFGAKSLIDTDINYKRATDTLFKIATSDMPVEIGMIWLSSSNYSIEAVKDKNKPIDFVMEFDELLEFSDLPLNRVRDILTMNEKNNREDMLQKARSVL